jgi:capsular polysaccharide biosynthesis protein
MVLESAALPEYPFTRSRKSLVILGAVASLIGGVITAFLIDLRHPVIRSAAQMEHVLGLRPVVSIPQMRPQKPRKRSLLSRLTSRR